MLLQMLCVVILFWPSNFFHSAAKSNDDAIFWMRNSIISPISLTNVMRQNRVHVYVIQGSSMARKLNIEGFITGMELKIYDHIDVIDGIYITPTKSLQPYVTQGYLSPQYNAKGVHQRVNHGRLACQLSLVKVLNIFLNSSHATAVIFEDDITIANGFSFTEAKSLMANMLQIPPREWDLQYMGFCFTCESNAFPIGDLRWITKGLVPLCTHAIVFNRRAAKLFLDQWAPLIQPGDVTLSQISCKFGLKVLRPLLPIFSQNRSLSLSGTGNKDHPLVLFRSEALCRKHILQCADMYSPIIAQKYGIRNGPIRKSGGFY